MTKRKKIAIISAITIALITLIIMLLKRTTTAKERHM